MKVIVRVVLVLLLVGVAAALLLQNSTPVLALTVLGFQLPALRLGALILLACGLGVLTGVGFNLLFNRLQSIPVRSRQQSRSHNKAGSFTRRKSQKSARTIFGFNFGTKSAKTSKTQSRQSKTAEQATGQTAGYSEGYSDWYAPPQTDWVSVSGSEYDSRSVEEWDDDRRSDSRGSFTDFEQRSDEPFYETEGRSGRSQSVVDAEYRVLNSPNPASTSQQRERVDEWDDDFFDEE
jgi:hypothetical protein